MVNNIIIYTKYCTLGASSRMRFFQYTKYLTQTLTVYPLFDDKYLSLLYANKEVRLHAIIRYFLRFIKLILSKRPHGTVVIEKELFPYIPFFLEKFILMLIGDFILDYDDATFHSYDQHKNRVVRYLLRSKIPNIMSKAQKVVCGNEYLARFASQFNPNVVIVPTVLDTKDYDIKKHVVRQRLVVGWIGTPATQHYLTDVYNVVKDLSKEIDIKLVAIGAHNFRQPSTFYEEIDWSKSTERDQINLFDVGIMPLPDEHFERGKCGFKLLQYMAAGLPVIASPVGVNSKLISHGKNGFIAVSSSDWRNCLIRASTLTPEQSNQMGRLGRSLVESEYSLLRWSKKFATKIYV